MKPAVRSPALVATTTRLLLPSLVLLVLAAPCAVVCISPGDHTATETPFAPCPERDADCEDVALTLLIAAPPARDEVAPPAAPAVLLPPRAMPDAANAARDAAPPPPAGREAPHPRVDIALRI